MSDGGNQHEHDQAAHHMQPMHQDEGLRQHPQQPEQAERQCRMQRSRLAQVLHHQQQEDTEEQRIGQLHQIHPTGVQQWPVDFYQPLLDALRETPGHRQRHSTYGQQHGGTGDQILEKVAALAPDAEQAIHQRQQQATEMEDQRGILTHYALLAKIVGLRVEQEIGQVDHDQQGKLALTAVHHAEGAAEQQQ